MTPEDVAASYDALEASDEADGETSDEADESADDDDEDVPAAGGAQRSRPAVTGRFSALPIGWK